MTEDRKNFFIAFPALEEPVICIVLQGALAATYKLSFITVDLPSFTPSFLVLYNSPWRGSRLQEPKSCKELKQPDVNSFLPICVIFNLVTLRQQVRIRKTSRSELHSIARAEHEGRGRQSDHNRRAGGTGK